MGHLEKILDLLSEIHATSPLVLPVVGFVVFVFLLRLYLNLPLPAPSIEVGEPKGLMPPGGTRGSPSKSSKSKIACYDPGTMELLGYAPAMTPSQVRKTVENARLAADEWKYSSFAHRKHVLSVMLKYILEHAEEICKISAIDSGKPMVDAAFGELIVTCEKIRWLMAEGEKWLSPEYRSAGRMMFYKKAKVEYVPIGVIGAIVPFNYPFHNIFNPLLAAVYSGNAIVIKVSEHGSWSALHYAEAIRTALDVAGAPPDLVQIVTGYGDAGEALVKSGVGKVIFVGSTVVGKKVMAAAADTLTPVVLELGGKDPFIVCEDADLDVAVPTALRGAFQACGQNCTGAERFIIHEKIADKFLEKCVQAVEQMLQGPASQNDKVDFGSLCLPGLDEKVQSLVDDAVARGAQIVTGGAIPSRDSDLSIGQFYPPTILTGVTKDMRIWHEEVFGPVMSVVTFATDEEAVLLANDSDFGLGSSVFCRSKSRARKIANELHTGMSSINDFAATYMAQSLPFGGVKFSGFDRFAGIEGLRGMCIPKAVAEDRWPFKTAIPPMLQYPVKSQAFKFVTSLVWMFYSESWSGSIKGLFGLVSCFLPFGQQRENSAKSKDEILKGQNFGMLARRLALFHRLNTVAAPSQTLIVKAGAILSKQESIRKYSLYLGHRSRTLSGISKRNSMAATAQGTSAGVTSEEVEALRKQVEDLKTELRKKEDEANIVAPYSRSFSRTMVKNILESESGGLSLVGQTIRVGGWVKTGRVAGAGAFAFLEVNDGSCFTNLQVMVDQEVGEEVGGLKDLVPTATCVLIEGQLAQTPEGTKQKVELKATKVLHVGRTDATKYPLAKKKQSMEYLRDIAHLRPRTNTIGAVARIRNALAYATHKFFQENGFLYVHTPIITASDCEGAGEMFQVTTLLSDAEKGEQQNVDPQELEAAKEQVALQGTKVKELKAAAAAEPESKDLEKKSKKEVKRLLQMKKSLEELEEKTRIVNGIQYKEDGSVDYSKDFFGRKSYLTVSGQLNGEYYACALSNIYTFGPTFRAENSHTSRHLAEFWMIEPEMAFCTLEDDMQCAEDYVRFCCRFVLDNCRPDLEFITKMIDSEAISRLEQVASTPFMRLSYTEAIEKLEEVVKEGKKKFQYPVAWGIDLQSEHERYLTEEVYKQPVIVYNYPKDIKAFYMRLNDDQKTVAAMDVLVPRVGELIGGSQREDRLDILEERITASGMPLEAYAEYLDMRRYGTNPHSGFGLGFERLILFATGIDNIRDVIPFPRWPGHAEN